jgi:hypothetical protein
LQVKSNSGKAAKAKMKAMTKDKPNKLVAKENSKK